MDKQPGSPRTTRFKKALIAAAVLVVGASVFAIVSMSSEPPPEEQNSPAAIRRIPVVLTKAAVRQFEDRLVVQGTLEAKNLAVVPARVAGTIEVIFVDEGDSVVAGKTKLFQTDAVKMQKTVAIRKQELAVAQCERREKVANLEKVQADLYKAELDYNRYKKLLATGVSTADIFERMDSRYRQAKASRKLAQAQIDVAVQKEQQAALATAVAEKDLCDTLICAPISGKITRRYREPGEMGQPGQAVVRIEDPAVVEVSAFLPAQYYAAVQPGRTRLRIHVHDKALGEPVLMYRSPTIDTKLRTFEIKCVLDKPGDGIVAGAIAEIQVIIESRKAVGVPSEAIQIRGGRPVVFIVEDGEARMVPVETGIETDGWVEIRGGTLNAGAPVISMGQFMVSDGAAVAVQKKEAR